METWLQQILNVVPEGGIYLSAIFVVAFFESLPVIGLLMPGSTLIVFAGFLSFHGKSELSAIITVAMLGALTGDLISFYLGHRFGPTLLRLRLFKRRHQLVTKAEQFFVDHGGKSILFARFLGPIRGITPFIAGLSGMESRLLNRYAAISAVLWGISYPGLGYIGGQSWQYAQSLSLRFGLIIVVVAAIVVVHQWVSRNIRP